MKVISSANSILYKENTASTTTSQITKVPGANSQSQYQQSKSHSTLNRRSWLLYEQSYLGKRLTNHQYLLMVVKSADNTEESQNQRLISSISSVSVHSYKIHQIIGELCMTPDQGQKVYNLIYPKLIANRSVELDFAGVKICIPPFLNFALGQLFKDIQPDTLNHLLKISNLNPISQQTLQLVMENAKCYYSDENLRQAVDQVLTEQSVSL